MICPRGESGWYGKNLDVVWYHTYVRVYVLWYASRVVHAIKIQF